MNLCEVSASLASSEVEGCYGNRNQPEGNAYKKLWLFNLKQTEEPHSSVAVIANMSCHSTILKADTMKFSADLAGAVRREISDLFHAPCIMTIGAAGDISSRFQVQEHDYPAVLKTGKEIGRQIGENIGKQVWKEIAAEEIQHKMILWEYIYDPAQDMELQNRIRDFSGTRMEFMIATMKRRVEHGVYSINTRVEIFKCSEFIVIFFPGEMVTALGDKIRNSVDIPVIICCYANDYWQYFVGEEEYGKFFETANSICPRGIADRFVDIIIHELKES